MHWSFITYLYLEYILGNNQQSYLSDSEKRALQQKIDDKNKEIEKLKEDANRNIQCDIGASERLVRWNEISYLVDKKEKYSIVEMHKINYIIAIMKIFFRVKWRGGHPNANEDCKRKRRKTQRIKETREWNTWFWLLHLLKFGKCKVFTSNWNMLCFRSNLTMCRILKILCWILIQFNLVQFWKFCVEFWSDLTMCNFENLVLNFDPI